MNSRRKHLIFDSESCTGCLECEDACSSRHPSEKPRIRVHSVAGSNFAVICQHCEDPAPCQKACPQGAIGRNEIFNAITVSKKQCFGCAECVEACPFGAITLDDQNGKAYKCDLCKGDPACVKQCKFAALSFGEASSEIEAEYRHLFEKLKSFLSKA